VDHDKYAAVSKEIMALLRELTPLVEPVSIDEAFLDVTASRRLFGDGARIGADIKRRVRAAVGLTASVGVAANKFVAKVASDVGKPDGLVVVPPGDEAAFLAPLPVSRLWGVGKVAAEALEAVGLRAIGQIAALPPARLVPRFGTGAATLVELAHGHDDRPVESGTPPKSMGAEETFSRDLLDGERLRATLRGQAERVGRELRAEGYAAATVTLKVRFADFSTITRAHTGAPLQDGLALYREAVTLLDRLGPLRPVRLIGLSASGLGPADRGQLSLLDPAAPRRERLARAVDRLAERFGEDAVRPATLGGRRRPRRPGPEKRSR
jgi:DNA polymerase-4